MKRTVAVLCSLLVWSTSSFAATLETVISYFAPSSDAPYTANDWSSLNSIAGVKWASKGVNAGPVNFSRFGSTKLDKLGAVDLFFKGARTMVLEGSVLVSEGKGKIFEHDQFDAVLKAQFSPETNIKKIRGVCAEDVQGVSGNALYEVTLKNRKAVFVLAQTDSGGNSPNSRSSGFQFSLMNEPRWKC